MSLKSYLKGIADAIREKKGTTKPINAQNFVSEIKSIKTGIQPTGTIEITENGEYNIANYETAFVNVDGEGSKNTLKRIIDMTGDASYLFHKRLGLSYLTGLIYFNDTSNAYNMANMFYGCNSLYVIPALDTKLCSNFKSICSNCKSLHTVEQLDLRSATLVTAMFSNCSNLTTLNLKNIPINLQVGSSSYGSLLTLESLIGLCQECIQSTSSLTLTVGTANLNKLANVYVKLTNEPEEVDGFIKLPMVQCESTDEGAMTIADYMALKNWVLA